MSTGRVEKEGLLAQHNSFDFFYISFKTSFCLFFKEQEKKSWQVEGFVEDKSVWVVLYRNIFSPRQLGEIPLAFLDSQKDFLFKINGC